MSDWTLRPYDPESDVDRQKLWRLKTDFGASLGNRIGDDTKAVRYEWKLTERYRDRWLAWSTAASTTRFAP